MSNNLIRSLGASTSLQDRTGITIDDNDVMTFINGLKAASEGEITIPITQESDFPVSPTAGVYLLPSGVYDIKKTNIDLGANGIGAQSGATVLLKGNRTYGFVSSTTDAFFKATTPLFVPGILITEGVPITLTGNGVKLFDLNGLIADFDFTNITCTGTGVTPGSMINSVVSYSIRNSVWVNVENDIFFDATPVALINQCSIRTTGVGTGPKISIGETVSRASINSTSVIGAPTESIYSIIPSLSGKVFIDDMQNDSGLTFFEIGTSGAITLFTDFSFSAEAITSVTDSSGIARFNFSTAPQTIYVGQEVVNATFVTSTYNGTFIISATDGTTFFEIATIAFAINEVVGDFSTSSVQVTSTTHGRSELSSLSITDTLEYNDGYKIYNALTNTYQINRPFVTGETSGTWDTNSLTGQDKRVDVTSSSPEQTSKNIVSFSAKNNTTATVITTINVWVDINMNGTMVRSSNAELWEIIDLTTGAMRYIGLNPYLGSFLATFSSSSTGGAQEFEFRVVKNGVPLADGIVSSSSLNSDISATPLVGALTAVTGDIVKVQVRNINGTSNILIKHVSSEGQA